MSIIDSDISMVLTSAGQALIDSTSYDSPIALDRFELIYNSREQGSSASSSVTSVDSIYTGYKITARAIDADNLVLRCEIPKDAPAMSIGGVAVYSGVTLMGIFYWSSQWKKPANSPSASRYFELILSTTAIASRVKFLNIPLAFIRKVSDLPVNNLINKPQVWLLLDNPGSETALGQTWFIAFPKYGDWTVLETLVSQTPTKVNNRVTEYASSYRDASSETITELVSDSSILSAGGSGYLFKDASGRVRWRSVTDGLATPSTPGFSPAAGNFGDEGVYALKNSPAFTGVPTAPTATLGTETTQLATTAFVQAAIDALKSLAPEALDTLEELAAALNNDENFAATVTAAIAAKLDSSEYTAADVLDKLLTVDGSGSGIDSDTIRGTTPSTFGLSRLADADASSARTGLGLGSAALLSSASILQAVNNLSDLASASSARTNLGLGSAALLSSAALLQAANNLSDLASVATARTNLGLGTAAIYDVGTSANNIVQLDGTGKLPAVDGSQLTNVSAAGAGGVRYDIAQTLSAGEKTQARSNIGTIIGTDVQAYSALLLAIAGVSAASGKLLAFTGATSATVLDYGTGANAILQLDSSGRIPAVDGSQITNLSTTSAADQTAMEAASSTTTYVSPGRQHLHPGFAKAVYAADVSVSTMSGNISSVDTSADTITWSVAHGLVTGDMIVPTSAAAWPGGVTVSVPYYINAISTTVFALYTTRENAIADTSRLNLTSAGSGTRTASKLTFSNVASYGMASQCPVSFVAAQTNIQFIAAFNTAFSSTSYGVLCAVTMKASSSSPYYNTGGSSSRTTSKYTADKMQTYDGSLMIWLTAQNGTYSFSIEFSAYGDT